jgi:hypothetical protein
LTVTSAAEDATAGACWDGQPFRVEELELACVAVGEVFAPPTPFPPVFPDEGDDTAPQAVSSPSKRSARKAPISRELRWRATFFIFGDPSHHQRLIHILTWETRIGGREFHQAT